MAQEQVTRVSFFSSGYCTAPAAVVDPKRGKGKATFAAVWALIQFAEHGYALFDTGYGPDFFRATASFPDSCYAWVTPVTLKAQETAAMILSDEGIDPKEIRYVFLSHFHADHIAGISAFPNASIICCRAAWEEWQAHKGFSAVRKGLLKSLIPSSMHTALTYIENLSERVIDSESGLVCHRFWNQDDLQLVELPGHARGMLGFIFKSADRHIFYGTDAAWNYDRYREAVLPSAKVRLFIDSWKAMVETQEKMRKYEDAHPDCKVLFTHCPKTLSYLTHRV